jgi:hypothetical protein
MAEDARSLAGLTRPRVAQVGWDVAPMATTTRETLGTSLPLRAPQATLSSERSPFVPHAPIANRAGRRGRDLLRTHEFTAAADKELTHSSLSTPSIEEESCVSRVLALPRVGSHQAGPGQNSGVLPAARWREKDCSAHRVI